MSWLSGFAEKAEELLNQVDRQAAQAAAQVTSPRSGASSIKMHEENESRPSSNISSTDYQTTLNATNNDNNDIPSSASSSSYAMVNASEPQPQLGTAVRQVETQQQQQQQPQQQQQQEETGSAAEAVALRQEIQLLTQELQSVNNRCRRQQKEMRENETKSRSLNELVRQYEQKFRDFETQEQDQKELLRVRETQLEATKKQLEEVRNNAAEEAAALAASDGVVVQRLKEENSRIHSKCNSLEEELQNEKRKTRDLEHESLRLNEEHENEREQKETRIADLERRLAQHKETANDAGSKLRNLQLEAERARQELSEYKEKASRVLQSKERLIQSLQNADGDAESGGHVSLQQLQADIEEIRAERDWLKDELNNTKVLNEQIQNEQRELEQQLSQNNESAQERLQMAQEALQSEKRQKSQLQAEVERWRNDAENAESRLVRTRADLESKISDLEVEIQQAKQQNSQRNSTAGQSGVGDPELVARIQALTESLVQKQLVVEQLTAEKSSLGAQLNRLERQYREFLESTSGTSADDQQGVRSVQNNILISGFNDSEPLARLRTSNNQYQPPMRESAFDTPVARTAKKVVNQLDRFAGHTAIVFRRFPLARPFLLIYMIILHLWVTFVLLTYQPEIHTHTTDIHRSGAILPPMPVDDDQLKQQH